MPNLFGGSGQTVIGDDIQAKKQLAQMLMMQTLQPNQGAMASNSPLLAAMAPLAAAFASKRAMTEAGDMQKAKEQARASELAKIVAAGQGTPEQVIEKPISGPLRPGEDLGSTQETVPGQPGGRSAMVNAMLSSSLPEIQQIGLKASLEKPGESWVTVPGPRGSLLQRNTATGEMKSVVGTTDPKLLDLIAAQTGARNDAINDPNAPWRNIRDPKKADDARIRFGIEADKAVGKANEDAASSQAFIEDIDRFLYLNERRSTGVQYKVPGAKTIGSALSEDVSEMIGITDRLTPQMRQGLPGAASDRDIAMFRGGTVGVEKQPEANKNVAVGLKVAHQNRIDRANFYSQYATDHGHTRGAEVEWKNYLNANPIFDHSAKKGSYVLNQNRMSYEEWVGAGKPKAPNAQKAKSDQQSGVITVDW